MTHLYAALMLGALGSFHCIGMCGPLMLAIPSSASSRFKFIIERILYNVSRAVCYAVLGFIFGFIGNKVILVEAQQYISLILGIILLIGVAIPLSVAAKLNSFSPLQKFYRIIQDKFGSLLHKKGIVVLMMMGFLNGLLPCGLTYTALVGAAVVADAYQSALFMFVFGLGTIPALVAVSIVGKVASLKFKTILSKALPVISVSLAIILILRGLNLGIPLISPKISQTHTHTETKTEVDCCHEDQ